MAPIYNSSFFRAVTLKTRVFYFRRVTIHITATVILINMPRRSKRSLKAVAQNSEKGKGFGPVVTIIGTSPTSVVSIHYLDLLIYCNLCVPFEDLSDVVVGEDLNEEDNRDTGDDENCGHQGLSWTAERNFTMLRIARLKTMNNSHLLYVALEEG